ncbi:MAG: hypothetical protein AAGF15_03890, partial [Pseudomonadota bacterium]
MTLSARSLVLIVFTIGLFGAGYYLLTNEQEAPSRRFGGQVSVEVSPAKEAEFADLIEAVGTANAKESVTITANVSEVIENILFEEGQSVKAGTVLVR